MEWLLAFKGAIWSAFGLKYFPLVFLMCVAQTQKISFGNFHVHCDCNCQFNNSVYRYCRAEENCHSLGTHLNIDVMVLRRWMDYELHRW